MYINSKKNKDMWLKCAKKDEQGITLVVLIITVVIMLILAAVTINVTLGEGGILDQGILDQARLAKAITTNSTKSEQEALNSLMQEFSNIMGEDSEIIPPETGGNNETGGDIEEPDVPDDIAGLRPEVGEPVEILDNTITVKDDLQNNVVIPGGFGIASDSGTRVEEGIVIEDASGNQFVWIPTGTYNVSTSINSSRQLKNNLSRRTFTSSNATEVSGDSAIESYFYGEGDSRSVASGQIAAFKASAESTANGGKGGFYIGRYEQGTGNVIKAGVTPWTDMTRDVAKAQAELVCDDNDNVESELISSYAWDTALNFICQTNVGSGEGYRLALINDIEYGNFDSGIEKKTGEHVADNYSNIHDLLGNCSEWTTEAGGNKSYECVSRGGNYFHSNGGFYAAGRMRRGT